MQKQADTAQGLIQETNTRFRQSIDSISMQAARALLDLGQNHWLKIYLTCRAEQNAGKNENNTNIF